MKPHRGWRCACALAALLLLNLAWPQVWAHPDWLLSRIKAPHGGQLRNAGPFHCELVLQGNEILVYVTDHFGNPFPTKNSGGVAVVVNGEQSAKIKLEPGGDNLLKGVGEFKADENLRVGVLLQAQRYEPQAVRFAPIAVPGAANLPPAEILDPSILKSATPQPAVPTPP